MTRLERDERTREADLVEMLANGWALYAGDVPVTYDPRFEGDPQPFLYVSESDEGRLAVSFAAKYVSARKRASTTV